MFVSLKWLKELVSIPYSVTELDNVLTMMGVEVEEIVDYGTKYNNFYTAKVLESEKHPDADKLSICKVDYGKGINTVVCGAPNVVAGQSVIMALPGAIVPSGGFEIKIAKIRKVESSGMICSETEMELGDDSSGIMVLPEGTEAGIPLADFLELDDVVMDLSLTPNKSDCNSHLGIAREVAAHDRTNVTMPQINLKESDTPTTDAVEIVIEDKINCPRYAARVIRGAKIGESPEWLKKVLVKIGLRPRNIAVDVTNFVLMECGHPLHAFDADKLAGNKIVVKTASNGEKFT
ncbi:MAG: phenylalanine--tRNA ligase subunit beta, partial [Chlorobi bacterium]|nr:phenylalanine--tRNA ligase subunit beta [Chlorobiota bacterium]